MLEQAIDKLTAAIAANTEALLAGGTATPAEPPAKPKAAPPKKEAKPKAKPEPEPEPEEEESGIDRDAILTEITEFVKNAIITADDSEEVKDKFSTFRQGYNVERASEVPDDKLEEFLEGVKELLG